MLEKYLSFGGAMAGHPWHVAGGLVILVGALFMMPLLLRNYAIILHRDAYRTDEFEVEYFSDSHSVTFGGHVVSSGEHFASDRTEIVGTLEEVRRLHAQNQLVDHRFPVLYVPNRSGFWKWVDYLIQFRIIRLDEINPQWTIPWTVAVLSAWLVGIRLLFSGIHANVSIQIDSQKNQSPS